MKIVYLCNCTRKEIDFISGKKVEDLYMRKDKNKGPYKKSNPNKKAEQNFIDDAKDMRYTWEQY